METALLEVGLAPSCVHTDKRERKYYLMKRFVRDAIRLREAGINLGVKIVAFFYETPFNFKVMVNGDAHFEKVADIFCTLEFTNDERREILMALDITTFEKMECEVAARGYQMNYASPIFAVITF